MEKKDNLEGLIAEIGKNRTQLDIARSKIESLKGAIISIRQTLNNIKSRQSARKMDSNWKRPNP